MRKERTQETGEKIYNELQKAGIEVLFDDRVDITAGFKFNDADLIGLPVQVIVGEKKLAENKVEVKVRKTGERFDVAIDELTAKLRELLG